MTRSISIAAVAATFIALSGCANTNKHVDREMPMAQLQDATITGKASYRERIALLPGSSLDVRLVDISRADAPSIILAQETRVLNGEQVPLPFAFSIEEHKLKLNMRYAVQARIFDPAGNLAWTTDTVHPIDPGLRQQDLGTLTMVRLPR